MGRRVVEAIADWPEVEAVALGGSHADGAGEALAESVDPLLRAEGLVG